MTNEIVLDWLNEVKDPEIPVLSIVDLGVITAVSVAGKNVAIEMTPTFTGCPAIDIMKSEIEISLRNHGVEKVDIEVSFRIPWTSDRISERGKIALKNFGLAPPQTKALFADLDILEAAQCPRCDGYDTTLKSYFGATLCRAIYYCNQCKESFEQFKAL